MRRMSRRGFTLLEMMIAVAIGMIVVAGLYGLFNNQLKSFVYQDLQMEMHQNARLSLDVLSRTARQAGMGTSGVTAGNFGYGGSADQLLPAIISYDGTGPNGSDAVTFVTMDPDLVMMTQAGIVAQCGTTDLTFEMGVLHNTARISQYSAGEMVMCYDYASAGGYRSFLWQITTNGNSTSGLLGVEDGTAFDDYESSCPSTENLPASMVCSRAEVATFYIDADDDGVGAGTPAHPVLMMDLDFESPDADDIPLVDNIEDLQIQYCFHGESCETDPSGGHWDESIDNGSDGVTTNDADDVFMVRFSVVVRSSREDLSHAYPGVRIDLANNTGVTSVEDNYYRQVNVTDVTVRNMRIQHM